LPPTTGVKVDALVTEGEHPKGTRTVIEILTTRDSILIGLTPRQASNPPPPAVMRSPALKLLVAVTVKVVRPTVPVVFALAAIVPTVPVAPGFSCVP